MFLFHMWALASGLYICVYVGMASKETRKLGRSELRVKGFGRQGENIVCMKVKWISGEGVGRFGNALGN